MKSLKSTPKIALWISLIFISINSFAQIPTSQVFYLDFDNNSQANGTISPITAQNITYVADRFNNASNAVQFNGCGVSPSFLRYSNTAAIQFSTGFSISFWLKADLSTGMNPTNGTCDDTGHQVLFAKGGDGIGTSPGGIYSKFVPNGGYPLHVLASSAGSGGVSIQTDALNSSNWNFYTYVISTTNSKLYQNGTKILDQNTNINFTEMNAQDLFLGIMGPKTTAALGITNWFPLHGVMDDFRIFNALLTDNEISNIYQFSSSAGLVGQVLYLSFDNTANSAGGLNPTTSQNITFVPDRFNQAAKAVKFNGCGASPSYLRYPNSSNLQFSTGFSATFWLKADLSSGMSPADGTCNSGGHQMIFAKGGDGVGTSPGGVYTKLVPNGGNPQHVLGSSASSGAANVITTIPNTSDWNFYSYVVTPTLFKLYQNGTKILEQAISINFSEMNAQDLFLGIMGPKSTPAAGITNWYPLNGTMDEFRLFNTLLSDGEITTLYLDQNNTPLETPPAVSFLHQVGQNYKNNCSPLLLGPNNKMETFVIGNETILFTKKIYNDIPSARTSVRILQKIINDSIVNENYHSYAYCEFCLGFSGQIQSYFSKRNEKYYLIESKFSFPNYNDSLYIFNNNLLQTVQIYIGDFPITDFKIIDDNILLISKEATKTTLNIFNLNGLQVYQTTINDQILDYQIEDNRMIFSSNSISYFFQNSLNAYTILNYGGYQVKFLGNKILFKGSNIIEILDLTYGYNSTIYNAPGTIFSDSDASYFFLGQKVSNNYVIKKFDSNNNLLWTHLYEILIYSEEYDIEFKNGSFLISSYPNSRNNKSLIINSDGNIIYQSPLNIILSNLNKSGNSYIFSEGLPNASSWSSISQAYSSIVKVNLDGQVKWRKTISNSYIYISPDESIWIESDHVDLIAMHLNNDANKCNYKVIAPIKSTYALPINNINYNLIPHSSTDQIGLSGYRFCYLSLNPSGFNKLWDYAGNINFEWFKNDALISSDYFTEFTGNGNYKLKMFQENCVQESPVKYSSYNSSANPTPPTLAAKFIDICLGESTEITGECNSYPGFSWIGNLFGSPSTVNVTPVQTTSYSANCLQYFPQYYYDSYGIIKSQDGAIAASAPASLQIQVKSFNNTLNLSGFGIDDDISRAGKIISTQQIDNQINNNYRVANSVELLPGFTANNGSVFKAEVYPGCQ